MTVTFLYDVRNACEMQRLLQWRRQGPSQTPRHGRPVSHGAPRRTEYRISRLTTVIRFRKSEVLCENANREHTVHCFKWENPKPIT